MSRAGSVHKDTSGLWSFVVDTAPLGAPRRRVIVEIAEWLDKRKLGLVKPPTERLMD